jgi:hypothetical protein
MTICVYLVSTVAGVYIEPIYGVKGQAGLSRQNSEVDCPATILLKCVSTGSGRTSIGIGDEPPFEFFNSLYEGGASINESRLGGAITAGNLSRSADRECSNMTDYCYTTFVEIHLTNETLCRVITCTLLTSSNTVDANFGSSTASRLSTCK